MSNEMSLLIGAAASIASVASFGPQAWKIIRTRDTHSISAAMYALTVVGFGLWFTYGVMLGQWPLIVTNGACFVFSAFILAMKFLPESGKQAVADAIDPNAKGD